MEYCATLDTWASILYWGAAHDALGRSRWRPREAENRRIAAQVLKNFVNSLLAALPAPIATLELRLFEGVAGIQSRLTKADDGVYKATIIFIMILP